MSSFGFMVGRVLFKMFINVWEFNKFKKVRVNVFGFVVIVLGDCGLVGRILMKNCVFYIVVIFDLENEGYDGMVEEMLIDVRRVDFGFNVVFGEFFDWFNVGKYEQFGCFEDILGYDYFVMSEDVDILVCSRMDNSDVEIGICS